MSAPTPQTRIYEWHRAALAGEYPERFEDEPHAGWYQRRFKKGGPFVPVRIYLKQVFERDVPDQLAEDEVLQAECLGNAVNPVTYWPFCRPIPEQDYHALVNLHRTEEQMMSATHVAIDLSQKPMTPPTR